MYKLFTVSLFALAGIATSHAQTSAPLALTRTIELPGVKGKFDHFAIDEGGNRLFAAAAGNQSVEVIDLTSGKSAQRLTGLGKPHGIAWIAETGRLFVADGAKAELDIYEGRPLHLVKSIHLAEDADDMVYDSASKLLYVGQGGTDAANPPAISVIDTTNLSLLQSIAAAAHPEALEIDPATQRIFANISDTGEIMVIAGATHAVAATWQLTHAKGNTPLAYDQADGLLLVGARTPAALIVLDAKSGTELARSASDTGADDLFFDPATHRAYLITGAGVVDSYRVAHDGKLEPLARTTTTAGAKTGLLVPSRKVLFVGMPGGAGPAEIRVYTTGAN